MMQQTARSGEKAPLFGGRKPLFTQSQLLKLTWPLLVEQLLEVTVGMADTMMVSRCGEAAISGVSLVDMINNLIIVLFAALATGGAVVVSQFWAQGSRRGRQSAGSCCCSAACPVLVVALLLCAGRPMIRLFYGSIDADVLDAGVCTCRSSPQLPVSGAVQRRCGTVPQHGQLQDLHADQLSDEHHQHRGQRGVHLRLENGRGWRGMAQRGVPCGGAALILRKCYQKGMRCTVPKTLRLDVGMTKRILGIGIPSAFENSLFEAGRILVVSMISTFGTVQIAANAVANNLDGMGVIPGKALSLAMITVVGQCVGARDYEQAVYYTRKLTLWAYLTMGLFNGAILLFLRPLVGIYELSGATMELAIQLVTIHAGCAIFFWPLSFVLPNALRAANDVKFTMIVSILSMAVWRLGFSYLLCVRMGWGAMGVWIAMVIDWLCRVTCFVTRFRSGVWKTKYHA